MSMHAYNSRNRGEPPPTRQSQPSREAVPWGQSRFSLPYPVSSSATPLEKRHFFFCTLKTIQSADGSYTGKVGALASRFETGEILLREAHGHLAPMYNEANRTPIWNSTAFKISNPVVMNDDGKRVDVPRRQSGDMTQSYTPGAKPDSGVIVNMVNTAQWQNQGFPSAEAADLFTTIASAATTPVARNGCLVAALIHSLASPTAKKLHVYWPVPVTHAATAPDQTTEQSLPPEYNKKPRTDIHHKHYMFSLWAQD
jgi:hypothetical protein